MDGDSVAEVMADVIEVLLADFRLYVQYMEEISMNLDTNTLIGNSISPQHQ